MSGRDYSNYHYTKIIVCPCVRTEDRKSFDLKQVLLCTSLLSIRSYNVWLYVCAGHQQEHQPTGRTLENWVTLKAYLD